MFLVNYFETYLEPTYIIYTTFALAHTHKQFSTSKKANDCITCVVGSPLVMNNVNLCYGLSIVWECLNVM